MAMLITGKCFLRAEELAPNSELARQWHSLLLAALGRFEEALAQINYARQLDPLSLVVQTVRGIVLYYGKKIDLAVEQYREALDADPSVQIVYFHLGRACLALEKYEEAVAQLEKAPIGFPMARAMLGAAYAKTGRSNKTIEILQELKCLFGQRYVGPLAFAVLHRGLGDTNTSLDLYDKAFNARDGFVPFLNVDPIVEDLRVHPDFKAMLKRLKLP